MDFGVKTALLMVTLSAAASGCASNDESPPEEPQSVAISQSTSTAAPLPLAKQPHTPDLAEPQAVATGVAAFTPPFPERLDLFEPPKRAQSTVRHDEDHGETVELKGFINVDQPRVVLSIDGVISIVPEGGEKYGVQVRSIEPPNVVLQRGRDRWTATLE